MATPSLAMIPSAYADSKVYSVLPNNGDGDFTFDRASTATRIGQNGLIQTVATDVPRLNYDISNGVVQSCPSLLLEPASTNLITYSEDFSNSAWSKQNVTVTSNQIISPDGTLNADKLTDDSTNGAHRITDAFTTSTSGSFTYSIFLKKGTLTTAQFQVFNAGTQSSANVDLIAGTITSDGQGVNHTIENYGNDWFKCSISGTFNTNATTTVYLYLKQKPSYIGNGDYLYAYGFQFEELSYATSYIPTNGASQTRAAETCNDAGTASTFNSTEGVLYAEVALNGLAPNSYIQISDNSYSNRVAFINNNSATAWRTFYRVGGASQIDSTASGLDVFVMNKIALSWKVNQFKFYVNGTKIVEDTSGSVNPANTFTRIDFSDIGNTNKFYGKVKGLAVYNEALTDAQLQTLTTL